MDNYSTIMVDSRFVFNNVKYKISNLHFVLSHQHIESVGHIWGDGHLTSGVLAIGLVITLQSPAKLGGC